MAANHAPPAGDSWSGHSARKCAALARNLGIGVRVLMDWGHWTSRAGIEPYLAHAGDGTISPSWEAVFFFCHLLPLERQAVFADALRQLQRGAPLFEGPLLPQRTAQCPLSGPRASTGPATPSSPPTAVASLSSVSTSRQRHREMVASTFGAGFISTAWPVK